MSDQTLPWRLKAPDGWWTEVYINVKPDAPEPPTAGVLSVRGMTTELTLDQLEQTIAALTEAARRIRTHAPEVDHA